MKLVMYFAVASHPMTEARLKDLLIEARDANFEHEVTGFLLYINGYFIQCIEGNTDKIDQLSTNIAKDPRIRDFTVLLANEIEKRSFPDWSMGYHAVSTDAPESDPAFRLIQSNIDLQFLSENGQAILVTMRIFYDRISRFDQSGGF